MIQVATPEGVLRRLSELLDRGNIQIERVILDGHVHTHVALVPKSGKPGKLHMCCSGYEHNSPDTQRMDVATMALAASVMKLGEYIEFA